MNAATCIICLVPYSEELEAVSLNCHHCFHRNCIKEWLKIRKECPQCRRKVNPKQIYKVILSFESSDMIHFPETIGHGDLLKLEKQRALIEDLEQQIKSKDKILEEKEAEIHRARSKLKRYQEINKRETEVQDLLNQLKVKDSIINQSLNDVKEIEVMLLELETASRSDAKQKDERISDLTQRLAMTDQLLQEMFQNKPKVTEDETAAEIQTLQRKLTETSKEAQSLHSKFLQISSIVDEFKLELVFNSFTTTPNVSSDTKDVQSQNSDMLTVDDLL